LKSILELVRFRALLGDHYGDNMQSHWPFLAGMTWTEADEALKHHPVGLLPVGAIEAHGPHLPLDTDIIIANGMAHRAAERLHDLGIASLVLPAITYTVSFVGTSFRGTSPVEAGAFESYLTSILRNLAPQDYRSIVVCNAHLEPAHVHSVQSACYSAEAASGIPIRSPDQRTPEMSQLLSEEFQAGARHAGSYETSIVMAEQPHAVRADVVKDLKPVWIDLPDRLRAGARTFTEAGADMGYFGNPARASAEEGHRMLDALAGMIIDVCRDCGVLESNDQSS
jgi:creatinine amidohydrolase